MYVVYTALIYLEFCGFLSWSVFCICSVLCPFGFVLLHFFLCCLILLSQSQSLSRRSAPFVPRVQVTAPVCLTEYSFGLFCFFFFFLFGKCIAGKWHLSWFRMIFKDALSFLSKKKQHSHIILPGAWNSLHD